MGMFLLYNFISVLQRSGYLSIILIGLLMVWFCNVFFFKMNFRISFVIVNCDLFVGLLIFIFFLGSGVVYLFDLLGQMYL